ncbi:MAG: hypothetical protein MJ206_01170 [Bacilli bacterium]|nr:hypothetical protein [Bacilli bacterium]MCQ2795126.1 hypothetical protein [Bacilli bacterium]
MLKHKKILSSLLVLPFFMLFSCTKAKEDYPVHRYSQEPEKVNEHLVVTGELSKKEYDSTKEETLSLDGLTISIDGQVTTDRKGDKESALQGGFFVCEREDLPTNSIVHLDSKAGTNVEKMDFSFYIGAAIKNEIYVSRVFTVTIKNPNAIKPWVWYTVTAVVVFGVVGMVMFTRYRKGKRNENITK